MEMVTVSGADGQMVVQLDEDIPYQGRMVRFPIYGFGTCSPPSQGVDPECIGSVDLLQLARQPPANESVCRETS